MDPWNELYVCMYVFIYLFICVRSIVSDVSHSSPSDDDDENEFYDAQDEACNQDTEANFILKIPLGHRRTSSGVSMGSQVRFHCYRL
jgi:hypothetical protein